MAGEVKILQCDICPVKTKFSILQDRGTHMCSHTQTQTHTHTPTSTHSHRHTGTPIQTVSPCLDERDTVEFSLPLWLRITVSDDFQ